MVFRNPPLTRAALAVVVFLGLGACQTTVIPRQQVPPPELIAAESDLMKPFAGFKIVIADQLFVDVSPNFYSKMTRPAGEVRSRGENSDNIAWDVRAPISVRQKGDLRQGRQARGTDMGRGKLDLYIGETVFMVTGKIRMRVLRKAPPTLSVCAKGDVRLLTDNAQKEDLFDELRFEAGRVRGRRPAAPAAMDRAPRSGTPRRQR